MPLPKLISRTMNAAVLGLALSGMAHAQDNQTPAEPTPIETPAPETEARKDCKISGRTILGAALGSILKSAGDKLGDKNGIDGLGRSAGEIGQGAVSPECSKNPAIKKVATPDFMPH